MNESERCSVFADNEAMIKSVACDNWERNKRDWELRGQTEEDIIQSCLCQAWQTLGLYPKAHESKSLEESISTYLKIELAIPCLDSWDKNIEAVYENVGGRKHVRRKTK